MQKYGARVEFTDGKPDLHHDADEPRKALAEALQKAKLAGRTPQAIFYDTDEDVLVYLYKGDLTMPESVYRAHYTPWSKP
jgi:hypothetical protein